MWILVLVGFSIKLIVYDKWPCLRKNKTWFIFREEDEVEAGAAGDKPNTVGEAHDQAERAPELKLLKLIFYSFGSYSNVITTII